MTEATRKRSHKKKPAADQAVPSGSVAADDTGADRPEGVIAPGMSDQAAGAALAQAGDEFVAGMGETVPLDEADAAVTTEHPVTCDKCGARLINVLSGALCPRGCGGLHPHVSAEDNAAAVRECRMNSLPQAYQLQTVMAEPSKDWVNSVLYRVNGKDNAGLWRRVKKESQSLKNPKLPDATLMAYDVTGDAVIWIARDGYVNGEIFQSFPEAFEVEPVTQEEFRQTLADGAALSNLVQEAAAKAFSEQVDREIMGDAIDGPASKPSWP